MRLQPSGRFLAPCLARAHSDQLPLSGSGKYQQYPTLNPTCKLHKESLPQAKHPFDTDFKVSRSKQTCREWHLLRSLGRACWIHLLHHGQSQCRRRGLVRLAAMQRLPLKASHRSSQCGRTWGLRLALLCGHSIKFIGRALALCDTSF